MYDWNGNGKHDVFDDAIFHSLLDDDLNRYPPKGGKRQSSSGDDWGCAIGCGATVGIVFFLILTLMGM